MRKHYLIIGCFVLLAIAVNSEVLHTIFSGFHYSKHFPSPTYRFEQNNISEAKFKLGRKLFFDPALSKDNTISCGSCHIPSSSFTQHGHALSHGLDDSLGVRNSPPIMNLAWSTSFMWDGGINDLDLQPIAPITNHVEMGETMENILYKVNQDKSYNDYSKAAYGNEQLTTSQILKSLSQYMLMCISDNAKYDSVIRGQSKFTSQEKQGYEIFKAKCNSCHKEPLFTDYSFRNNGVKITDGNDMGRYLITLNDKDKYKFKVPSLRNLNYTAPYMHDGSMEEIDEVLAHYANNMNNTLNVDSTFIKNNYIGVQLSKDEKRMLKQFLKTLNDLSFVNNKNLQEQ